MKPLHILEHDSKKNGELFVVSQSSEKKKPEHVQEAESLFGAEVTSYDEREWISFG